MALHVMFPKLCLIPSPFFIILTLESNVGWWWGVLALEADGQGLSPGWATY